MEIEQDCSIFDYTDIAGLIFDKLDFETIKEVAAVLVYKKNKNVKAKNLEIPFYYHKIRFYKKHFFNIYIN